MSSAEKFGMFSAARFAKAEFPLSKDGSLAVKARYAVSVKSGFKPSLTLEKNTPLERHGIRDFSKKV